MYQLGAIVADIYTPLLIISCMLLLRQEYQGSHNFRCTLLSLYSCVGAYGLMLVDMAWDIWPRFGADYSTHTAIALALVFIIVRLLPVWQKGRRASKALLTGALASLLAYMLLMKWMDYHTFLDMFTTALALLPWLYWLWRKRG